MKFRHKIEQINFNGVKETRVNYYHCDEIFLGRGSNCLIRLEDRSVALTHAKLFQLGDNLMVEDCSGGRGTYVNGKEVQQAVLHKDDQLKIGEVNFKVLSDPNYWGLFEVRREIVKEDSSELIGKQLKNLNLNKFYPRFWSLITLFVVAIIVFCFIDQYLGEDLSFWNSGPLSKYHKILENDCRSCHEKAYQTVRDNVCLRCHNLNQHAPVLKEVVNKHPEINFRCAHCHFEHNGGSAIKLNDSRLCLQCHGHLDKFYPDTKHPVIADFGKHPQFSVHLPQYIENEISELKKVSLDESKELIDQTRIKFPHKKHLVKDLKSPDGPKTLQCQECHKYTADLKNIEPINFQKNCSNCHSLGFDQRLADKVVPHGEANVVYNYLYAEYAKLFLDNEKTNSRKSFVQRFRPGQEVQADNPTVEFTKSFVEEEARQAEEQLFTKTACYLCHQIKRNDQEVAGKSNFYVYPPNIPKKWMPAAIFSHKPHQYLGCADCHHGVKDSETAKDILIPKINDCRSCHADGKHSGKVSADCVTCHSYHDSLSLK